MRLSALATACISAAVGIVLVGSLPGVAAIAAPPTLDCRRVTVDGYTYDLSPLNKYYANTTFSPNGSHMF